MTTETAADGQTFFELFDDADRNPKNREIRLIDMRSDNDFKVVCRWKGPAEIAWFLLIVDAAKDMLDGMELPPIRGCWPSAMKTTESRK